MRSNQFLISVAITILGLAIGASIRKSYAAPSQRIEAAEPAHRFSLTAPNRPKSSQRSEGVLRWATPALSGESVESLLQSEPEELYEKMALWLQTATSGQIAEFINQYQDIKSPDYSIIEMLFLRWTNLDPNGALAQAPERWRNTAEACWAINDPDAAFASIDKDPAKIPWHLLSSVYRYQSDWLTRNIDQFPAEMQTSMLRSLGALGNTDRPAEMMELLERNGAGLASSLLKSYVSQDPDAAFDKILAEGKKLDASNSKNSNLSVFVETIAAKNPERLQQFADRAPSGELKRKLQEAVFNHLLETDPAAAERQGMQNITPWFSRQQLGAVGLHVLESDPDHALEIADRLFEVNPEVVQSPKSVDWHGQRNPDPTFQLMEKLVKDRPIEVMEMVAQSGTLTELNSHQISIPRMWADRDPQAMGEWIDAQTDPDVIESTSTILSISHVYSENYTEAARRANYGERSGLPFVLKNWSEKYPEAATEWLNHSNLPSANIEFLKQYLSRP